VHWPSGLQSMGGGCLPIKLHETFLQTFEFASVDCDGIVKSQFLTIVPSEGATVNPHAQLERFCMSSINWDSVNFLGQKIHGRSSL
jgi:hypothetical protein